MKEIPLKHKERKVLIRVLVTGDAGDEKTIRSLMNKGWVAPAKKTSRSNYAVTTEGNQILDADLAFHRTGKPT